MRKIHAFKVGQFVRFRERISDAERSQGGHIEPRYVYLKLYSVPSSQRKVFGVNLITGEIMCLLWSPVSTEDSWYKVSLLPSQNKFEYMFGFDEVVRISRTDARIIAGTHLADLLQNKNHEALYYQNFLKSI